MCVATLCNSNCKITNFVENFKTLYQKILSSSAPLVFFKNPAQEWLVHLIVIGMNIPVVLYVP